MKTVQENVSAYEAMYEQVRNHCMCAQIEDDGTRFRVCYPAGDWPGGINGILSSYVAVSKLTALVAIRNRMELDWKDSFPQVTRADA